MFNRSFSKTMILGNVGKDPEIRYTASGSAVANLSVVSTKSIKNKETGNYEDKKEWHKCVAFGKLADNIAKHVKKGAKVYLEGEIETSSYTDASGTKKYSTSIIINRDFELVTPSSTQQPQQPQQAQQAQQPLYQQPTPPLEPQK